MPDIAQSAVCPPHHWNIGTAERIETWVGTRCHEAKVVDRKAIRSETPPFTRGTYRKPDSVPPPATDIPAELAT